MKIQYSVMITLLTLIVFLITLSVYIQYKKAERTSVGQLTPTITLGL